MASGIKDGSEDDPYRYQCCGTDDVHGRSSLMTALDWGRHLQFSVVGATEWPVQTLRMPASHPSSYAHLRWKDQAALVSDLFAPGGPVEVAVGALSGIRIITLFAGSFWPDGPIVRTRNRNTVGAQAQSADARLQLEGV
jgi:hypothetical protein